MPGAPSPYPSGLMAEFQWWLLLVGLVAGGGLVAIVSMDGKRREEDLSDLERRAEATWIAERMSGADREMDVRTVESILRVHREYLAMPPPDRLVVEGDGTSGGDGDADGETDDVGDDGGRGAQEDLPSAREEEAPAGEEAHAGADGEQGAER